MSDVNIDHSFIKMSSCIFYVYCLHVRHKFNDVDDNFGVSDTTNF